MSRENLCGMMRRASIDFEHLFTDHQKQSAGCFLRNLSNVFTGMSDNLER